MSTDEKKMAEMEARWAETVAVIKKNGITIDREYVKQLQAEFSQPEGALFTDEEIARHGKHIQYKSELKVRMERAPGPNANGDDFSQVADQRANSMSRNFGFGRTKCPRRPHRRDVFDGIREGNLFMISSFDSREVRIMAEMTAKCEGTSSKKDCEGKSSAHRRRCPDLSAEACLQGPALDLHEYTRAAIDLHEYTRAAIDLHKEYPISALKIDRSAAKTAQWSQFYDPIYLTERLKPLTPEAKEQMEKTLAEVKELAKKYVDGKSTLTMMGGRRLAPPGLMDIPENPTIQPMSKPSVTPEMVGFTRVPMTGFKTIQGIRGKTADVVIYDEVQDLPKEEPFDFDRYNGIKK